MARGLLLECALVLYRVVPRPLRRRIRARVPLSRRLRLTRFLFARPRGVRPGGGPSVGRIVIRRLAGLVPARLVPPGMLPPDRRPTDGGPRAMQAGVRVSADASPPGLRQRNLRVTIAAITSAGLPHFALPSADARTVI